MARKISPAKKRVEIVRAKRLGMSSALRELQENFLSKESRDVFHEWRTHHLTQLMVDVMRELALGPPAAYVDTDSISAQYGVSSGLGLAAAVFDDPSVLFPHLFTGVAPGAVALPETDYATDSLSDASLDR